MKRHHARRKDKNTALNMVSLMDIFTILVFFLLVNAASSDVLPTPKNIKLPRSTAETAPRENAVIIVGENSILLQGKQVSDTGSVLGSEQLMIMPLFNELKKLADRDGVKDRGVTIMGDREIPYELMKKIMLTCSAARFRDLSFAVNRVAPDDG